MRLSDFLEDLGSPVAYFPALCPLLGGVQPTLLFCQLAFLKGKERSPSGEIYKTQEQITAETGLTRNEQTTARRILKSKGLLTERYARLDHRMYYTVHLDVLNALWENRQFQHSRKLESNIREEWKVTFGRSEKQHSSEDPEITTEITTEITKDKSPPSPHDDDALSRTRSAQTLRPLLTQTTELPRLTPEELAVLYNTLTPPHHPKVQRLSPARRKKATLYLRLFPEEEFWVAVFTEIRLSAFLRGENLQNGHEGFRGDFDWLLTKGKDGTENCIKVQEGKYRDRQRAGETTDDIQAVSDAMAEAIAIEKMRGIRHGRN